MRNLIALVLLLAACQPPIDEKDDTDDTEVLDDTEPPDDTEVGPTNCAVTPGAWSAPSWEANTTEALNLRAALDALVGDAAMRGAETGAVVLTGLSDLTDPYNAGTPSLSSVATTRWHAVTLDSFAEFLELIDAGVVDLVDAGGVFTPGAEGGIFESSSRGIHEGGLEIRQLVDKGLFAGGAFFPYALAATEGPIDEATIDTLAALWGGDAALDFNARTDSANYTYGMGYYADVAAALTDAKAYAASADCTAERDEALERFFRTWELSMYARFIFYANSAATTLAAPGSDADVAAALHELSEGVGLGFGFYGAPAPASGPLASYTRAVTDAQLESLATTFEIDLDDLGASTTGRFVSAPVDFAAAVETLESTVKTAFSLDDATITAYATPTGG